MSYLINGIDVSTGWVSKSYLLDVYPSLSSVITSANLWCWGNNTTGQVGDGTVAVKSSPVQTVAGGSNWKQVAAGNGSTFGIKTDGTLWCWGTGTSGQLGDNTLVSKSSPVQTIASGTTWKQIAAGVGTHVAAIKTDGTLWLWGFNNNGQLGDNSVASKSSPVQTISVGTTWKSVSVGSSFTGAIKTDGTLWMCGYNSDGQLGTNDITKRSSPIQTVAGGSNWKQVACGQNHTVAIKNDGTLWSWGRAAVAGALGDGTSVSKSSAVQTTAGGTDWKSVSAGASTSLAVKTDGTLWTWGANSNGNLGNGSTSSASSPIQTIAGGSNWKFATCGISGSGNTIGAIKTDGTLWVWGNNANGQLAVGDTADRSSPIQTIVGGSNWVAISGGGFAFAAITDDGIM